jgi:Tol biopolymer transport system component
MKVKHFLILFFMGLLAACSIEVSDNPTAAPPAGNENSAVESPASGEETPAENGAAPTEPSGNLPPPAWAELGLEGSLYYNAYIQEQQNLLKLNLETGEQVTVFDPPENAWLSDVAVSPNGREIVIAYGPPPPEGQIQFGFTDLYTMPVDGSAEPTPLLLRQTPNETYYNISWPLDDYIYYAHFAPETDDLGSIIYISQVERLHIPSGESEVLVTAAAWPRLSPDGTMLAYVTDSNEFTISEPDGSNPRVLELPTERFPAVDAPLFSPDGTTLYFSVAAPEVLPVRSFWDRLMGVQVAEAHNVPSDWWRMPSDGSGEPEQLTNLFEIGIYGDFGPAGNYIAFITSTGVNVMNPDGTGVFSLKNITTSGTVDWVRE